MSIKLPVIQAGLVIGEIDLYKRVVYPNLKSPITFNCTSRVDCCSSLSIPVTSFDIERIEDAGYELDQIIRDSSPVILNPHGTVGKTQKAYILKKKPIDGTCTFLQDDLCAIHISKPLACRLYPFSLNILSQTRIQVIIHESQVCKSIKSTSTKESTNLRHLTELMRLIEEELEDRLLI